MQGGVSSAGRGRLRTRVIEACNRMTRGLIERDEPARLLVLAALCGEHVLLVGPPGTAKSELARRLRSVLVGGRYFERLLTKFSVPEEIFGPLSIRGLERDEYKRLTDGYLPTASVAFLDEIFNANSAILNALLTLLNEREFDNGVLRERCPLATVVGASNALGEGSELAALHDRFLFRLQVEPVSAEGFALLFDAASGREDSPTDPRAESLDSADLEAARTSAQGLKFGPAALHVLGFVRRTLASKEVYVSDRRWRKIGQALRVAAFADGREQVALQDCFLLSHCLWNQLQDRAVVDEALRGALGSIVVEEPRRLRGVVDAFQREVEKEIQRTELDCDEAGSVLYAAESGATSTERQQQARSASGELLFRPPPELGHVKAAFTLKELWREHFSDRVRGKELLEAWAIQPHNRVLVYQEPLRRPARYAEEHIRARIVQLEQTLSDVRSYRDSLAGLSAEQATIWPVAKLSTELSEGVSSAQTALSEVERRLEALVDAVAELRQRGG